MYTAMRNLILGMILIISHLPVPFVAPGLGALKTDERTVLDAPLSHDIDFSGTAAAVLKDVLRDTQIPGGVVQQLRGCSAESRMHLSVKKGTTIRQAMDNLVASNPDHQWQFLDHVVNLTPKTGPPVLLETRIHSYQLHTTDNWAPSASMEDLFKIEEIRKRAVALKLTWGAVTGGLYAGEYHPAPKTPRPIDVDIHDVSVQDALNAVVTAYRNAIWIYRETECNGETTFTINGWSN